MSSLPASYNRAICRLYESRAQLATGITWMMAAGWLVSRVVRVGTLLFWVEYTPAAGRAAYRHALRRD
ncbi:MAG: hypothetical protein M3281_07615 [Chloroflexota bacterium]|nr:hypothetical protein [Chloroflexota bacterium]